MPRFTTAAPSLSIKKVSVSVFPIPLSTHEQSDLSYALSLLSPLTIYLLSLWYTFIKEVVKMAVTMTAKHQITIPKKVTDVLGLGTGLLL